MPDRRLRFLTRSYVLGEERVTSLNIGTQGVQELLFCELKGFGDSRIKSMTCKMFY